MANDNLPEGRERRVFTSGLKIERRVDDDEASKGPGSLTGHAAVFDKLSVDFGGWREKLASGAFKATLADSDSDVRALFDHDTAHVIGRESAGSLTLREDETGLAFEVDLPDTQTARDLATNVEAGNITDMSFGFRTIRQEWDESDEDMAIRTLHEVELFEVSAVAFGAYPQTDVAKRGLAAWRTEHRDQPDNRVGRLKRLMAHRLDIAA